jgi:hypothetical protein
MTPAMLDGYSGSTQQQNQPPEDDGGEQNFF